MKFTLRSVAVTFAGVSLFAVAMILSLVLASVAGVELSASAKVIGTVSLVVATLAGLVAITLNNLNKEMDDRPMDVRPMNSLRQALAYPSK